MLYMVNNSQEVGPGRSSKLLEYDTSTRKYRVVTDKLRGLDDSVSEVACAVTTSLLLLLIKILRLGKG